MSETYEAEVPAPEAVPAPQVEAVQTEEMKDGDPGEDADPAEDREGDGQEPKPKGGFQRRISELTYRVRDTERDRDHWRDLAIQFQAAQRAPQPQQYEDYGDEGYEPGVPMVDPNAIISTVRQQLETESQLSSFNDQVAKTYPDGEPEGITALKRAPGSIVTPAIFDLVTSSQIAPKIADYLGMNQGELARLARLPPHRQGLEFARLETRLSAQQPATTKAPPPPPSVGARSSSVEKDPDRMSTTEWMKWRDAQLRKG
jgi:hypothetical protein